MKIFLNRTGSRSLICLALMAFSCAKTNPLGAIAYGTMKDIEGNEYKTVAIGNQVWMAENLRTTKFNDGTAIPNVTESSTWYGSTTPGYCFYNNTTNPDSMKMFGAIYNWYALDSRKLAPVGWHVPTNEEWAALQNYLIANGYNWDGSRAGNMIAKSMASTTEWNTDTTLGAIGNVLGLNNKSGFSALPLGMRFNFGTFVDFGLFSWWWTASEYDSTKAFFYELFYAGVDLRSGNDFKTHGLSVRLLMD
jgi:uncharacterized protein (TIGR02145 family)